MTIDVTVTVVTTNQIVCSVIGTLFAILMCKVEEKKDICKGKFLYSAVSSPLDRSKRLILYPQADLFIPTPTRLLREAF